jgi:hypothetical protein
VISHEEVNETKKIHARKAGHRFFSGKLSLSKK